MFKPCFLRMLELHRLLPDLEKCANMHRRKLCSCKLLFCVILLGLTVISLVKTRKRSSKIYIYISKIYPIKIVLTFMLCGVWLPLTPTLNLGHRLLMTSNRITWWTDHKFQTCPRYKIKTTFLENEMSKANSLRDNKPKPKSKHKIVWVVTLRIK